MRIGIVSDIHGNWTALQEVDRRLRELGVEFIIGVGDYLWTTTGDARCVNWIKTQRGAFVRGNGDSMAYYERHKHLAWTDPLPIYQAVAALPERVTLEMEGYRILVEHEWWPESKDPFTLHRRMTQPPYVSTQIDLNGFDIAIFGDSHVPLHRMTEQTLIIHPGSVGAPFDADPTQAKFATLALGPDGVMLEHHSVPFDVAEANREILEGRALDIGHSYYRKSTESRLKFASPNGEYWEPVPPPVYFTPSRGGCFY